MLIRVLAAAIGLPLLIVVVWLGGYFLDAVLALLAVIAAWELFRSCGLKRPWFYVGFLIFIMDMVSVSMIRGMFGLWHVWLIFIVAWGCDTGAYFAGMTAYRLKKTEPRKLAPSLSPKKTVVGAIGGVVTSAVLCVVYALILNGLGIWAYEGIMLVWLGLFGAVGAVLGQVGDLAASGVKRAVGIKDFGKIMPGHGGVLDRFDSIIFVAPVTFLFIHFIMIGACQF